MFGQPRRLRRLAAHVLLVWSWVLASGIVNACVVGSEMRQAATVQTPVLGDGCHPGPGEQMPAHAAPGHPLAHADKAVCAKACNNESSSAPAGKTQVDAPDTVWLAPPPTPSQAAVLAKSSHAAFDAAPALLRARVPIAIAYLRLTL